MKKKVIITVSVLSALILLVFSLSLISFFTSTTNDVSSVAEERSIRNATDFHILGYDNNGYKIRGLYFPKMVTKVKVRSYLYLQKKATD